MNLLNDQVRELLNEFSLREVITDDETILFTDGNNHYYRLRPLLEPVSEAAAGRMYRKAVGPEFTRMVMGGEFREDQAES
jgi:hypothetical protein